MYTHKTKGVFEGIKGAMHYSYVLGSLHDLTETIQYGSQLDSKWLLWAAFHTYKPEYRRWSCFGSCSFPEWLFLESQNGSNWSERVLNAQMAPMAPQKVPLVLCV